jgi:hypothetical protein
MNRKFAFFWLRNVVVVLGIVCSVIVFAIGLLFLNDYFNTTAFSIGFLAIICLGTISYMCYKIAQDQYDAYQYKSKKVMNALKKDYNE